VLGLLGAAGISLVGGKSLLDGSATITVTIESSKGESSKGESSISTSPSSSLGGIDAVDGSASSFCVGSGARFGDTGSGFSQDLTSKSILLAFSSDFARMDKRYSRLRTLFRAHRWSSSC
jgi:hypothetical protein